MERDLEITGRVSTTEHRVLGVMMRQDGCSQAELWRRLIEAEAKRRGLAPADKDKGERR